MNTELIGMDELLKYVDNLEKLPQKVVTASSKKGARISLVSAKALAPFLSGELESGIILKAEKSRVKGKKVYQTTLDRNKNDVFQKKTKSGKTAYYPASQEHGFRTRNGGYIPGIHYLEKSVEENAESIEKTIVESIVCEIDKLK